MFSPLMKVWPVPGSVPVAVVRPTSPSKPAAHGGDVQDADAEEGGPPPILEEPLEGPSELAMCGWDPPPIQAPICGREEEEEGEEEVLIGRASVPMRAREKMQVWVMIEGMLPCKCCWFSVS